MATATTSTPTTTSGGGERRDVTPGREKGAAAAAFRTYLGVAIIVIWGLVPFYWMVVTAFRNSAFTFDTTPWPTHVTLDNFRAAFDTSTGNDFGKALVTSLIIGICTTVIGLLVGIFAAYALTRLDFPFKFVILGVILGASMFPGVALLTPLFQLFTNIGWIGTYQALIIPDISFVLPLTIYTLTAFFREMPWELEESARIDGASKSQAFRLIILPLAAPGLFTTAILAFTAAWNEFLLAQQLSGQSIKPVTVAIANFQGTVPHVIPYTAIMAAGTIVTIPLVIMVLLFQRKIVSGLTAGGVKG